MRYSLNGQTAGEIFHSPDSSHHAIAPERSISKKQSIEPRPEGGGK